MSKLFYFLYIVLFLLINFNVFADENENNGINGTKSNENKSCDTLETSFYSDLDFIHIQPGVPLDNDPTDDIIIIRPQYILSYNATRNTANWVCWHLNSTWYGEEERYSGTFKRDTLLHDTLYKVKHSDYTTSGYDRGHLVRSKERTATEEDNISTFFLTNVIPQTPDLNRGVWLDFEYYCEELCLKYNKELYVIAGGIYNTDSTIKGAGVVAVPDSCFKIVLVLDSSQTIDDVNENTIVLSVVMPNIQGIRNDKWHQYTSTVRSIEYSTGYDFFKRIPRNIQDVIETKNWFLETEISQE